MRRKLLIIVLAALTLSCNQANTRETVLENSQFKKIFTSELHGAGPIWVSLLDKARDQLVTKPKSSYFEFVIDNQLVKSTDPLWNFTEVNQRQLGNGGQEHEIIFTGKKDPVDGLEVHIFQQIFDHSTLIRERLELQTKDKEFQLNKLDNRLHFNFPSYAIIKNEQDEVVGTEIRMASFEKKPITFGNKKDGNHMYYPDFLRHELSSGNTSMKGPVVVSGTSDISWFTAYEHASQDDLNGLIKKEKLGEGNKINDALQGTNGVFDFPIHEDDFKFIEIVGSQSGSSFEQTVNIRRGGYLDGEAITPGKPYSTVWAASAFFQGNDSNKAKEILRTYLLDQICEKPASRVPEFYYNTWGMQRNDRSKPLRGILTYDRIFKEIDYAAELGVDIFVLDDGWENMQGEWFPHKERLKDGLGPIKKKLDEYGIKMGLWYSPMGIDSSSQRYRNNNQWVIRDSEDNPIAAQWGHPAFDFVSGFYDVFVEECKKMIDEGCLFMKWDAINTFYSSLADLDHGSSGYPEEEIRARYEYLLPIYVVKAMEELTDYEPELIIEVDLTEARRVMVGLAPLSQGKLFWMNNGTSWYNDYSSYRSKSMRTIANEFAGIIPWELFTYASYPHNLEKSMKYNTHNSLLAGHGFWGNLELMNSEERKWIGTQVAQSKRVLPYLVDVVPQVTGTVGDSPELYVVVNEEKAAGQIIGFSDKKWRTDLSVSLKSGQMLAALNHPYTTADNKLKLSLEFRKDDSHAVIVLPNEGKGVGILSSTASISDARYSGKKLSYTVEGSGMQEIRWMKKLGKPVLENRTDISMKLVDSGEFYQLSVETGKDAGEVVIGVGG